jgi:hypothetical protein
VAGHLKGRDRDVCDAMDVMQNWTSKLARQDDRMRTPIQEFHGWLVRSTQLVVRAMGRARSADSSEALRSGGTSMVAEAKMRPFRGRV